MNKLLKTMFVLTAAVGYSECVNAAVIQNKSIVEQYNQNDIYNCDATELAAFIKESTKSLFMPLPVPNAAQFTAEKEKAGGDPCLSLFNNLDALKDLQRVIEVIQNFQMPSMPSMDVISIAAKLLVKKMISLATQSVCNALTKKAAMAVINKAMKNKVGFSIDDAVNFDPKSYAKGLATDSASRVLGEHGISDKWLYGANKADYMGMLTDEANVRVDMLKEKGRDVTESLADKMFN